MRLRSIASVLARALALTGALCSVSCLTTPASETGWTRRTRDAAPRACGPDALIEDGEDGDNRALVRDGRGGYWFTSVDPEGSTITPSGTFQMSAPGHDGSQGAAHMHGVMATQGSSVYASMGFSLADPRGPYDASHYAGVSFWAKGPAHIRFEIPDAYTDPSGGICKDCYNDFGVELAFTQDWQRYTIPFEWLAQRPGWGEPRPEISRDKLMALEWQFGTPGREYDVWVDDITFICGVEATQ